MRVLVSFLFAVLVISPLVGQLKTTPVSPPLEHPWSVAWLDNDTLLVTERPGRLVVVREGRGTAVAGVPRVATGGQAGLFDVLVLPSTGNRELVLSYAWDGEGGRSLRVVKATLDGNAASGWRLTNLRVLFDLLPRSGTSHHFGGRLALLPDGTLLLATGDRGEGERAQDLSDGAGKIHRLRLDGSVPNDNPFVGRAGVQASIWSWGHRNIQGLWVDPVSGDVWASEHGPQGGDEINLVRAGKNYGWPVITYGVNYGTGTKIGEGTAKAGLEQPVLFWKPSIAPSGLTRYEGSFLSGALAGQGLSRLRLGLEGAPRGTLARAQVPASGAPARLVEEQYWSSGSLGRIRDVRVGPDGLVYLVADEAGGRVYRVDQLPQ